MSEEKHGRTPENTPIPGGGSWSWDANAGAWVENKPQEPDEFATLTDELSD